MSTTTKPRTRSVILTPAEAREAAAGRLTEIRRKVKPQPREGHQIVKEFGRWVPRYDTPLGPMIWVRDGDFKCPLGEPGTVLLGRETWGKISWISLTTTGFPRLEAVYRAGPHPFGSEFPHGWISGTNHWRPASTMPCHLVRSRLTVVSVRAEQADGRWWWVAQVERIETSHGATR